jgi:hypothetical protein
LICPTLAVLIAGEGSPEAVPSAPHALQDVPPKSTSVVATVPAVRPGAVS